jgi:integrase/recombinase XerD
MVLLMTNDPDPEDDKTPTKVTEDDDENVRRKLPKVLTYDDIDRFILAIDDLEDLVACRLMLFGGLRVAEASALRAKDVSMDNQAVFVHMGKGGKDRWAPLDLGTLSVAHCYAHSVELKPDEPLFHYSKRTLQRHVTDVIYPRAGITDAGCHTLRHTCATWQLDKGIPLEVVKNNLGHESIEVTQIYLHLNIRQRSRIYKDCTRFGI